MLPIMGDWISPRIFFSSMTSNDIASRSVAGFDSVNQSGPPFTDHNSTTQSSLVGNKEASSLNSLVGPRPSTRGGLVERMAARAGFNAPRLNTESIRPPELYTNTGVRSPYFTIPPGLSPTTLLESPVFLSNSMAQPSPTTGKLPFFPSGSSRDLESMTGECGKQGKENTFEDNNASPIAFVPITESSPPSHLHSANRANYSKLNSKDNGGGDPLQDDQTYYSVSVANSSPSLADDSPPLADDSPPFDEQLQNDDVDQRAGDQDPNTGGGDSAVDSYNWRKYGQKHVKGSEYPRSYYKCTHLNCPVKKKVERNHEGHVTEIIYKGAHNHSKPPPNRRSVSGPASALGDIQLDSEQLGFGAASGLVWSALQEGNNPEYQNVGASNLLAAQSGEQCETGDDAEESLNFSNNNDDDRAAHGSVSLGYEGEGDESESKRRRIENYAQEMIGATRAIREPRVVVQTKSDVDILDDGYRWRKYGQKVVKGNPNPRSYYKCTSPGCNVRKHIERASHDLKSVITTYEGKHIHDVPAARNSNSGGPNTQQAPVSTNHVHRPDPSLFRRRSAWFERPPLASFGLPGQQQIVPSLGFGMNHQHIPSVLGLAGLGPYQGNLLPLPVHTYAGHQAQPVNEMAYMLPKEELKPEPVLDSGLSSAVGSSSYFQQLMSRLPLGPQM